MMIDAAVAYKRFLFLGNEFLTWLWYAIEAESEALRLIDPQMAALELGNRLVLQNHSHQATETVTIRGDEAGMEEGILALRKGSLVVEMSLIYRSGNERWTFTLKGESLNITGLKVPETKAVETRQDIEAAAIEKASLCQRAVDLVQLLFIHFIHLRLANDWTGSFLPSFRRWMTAKQR